MCTQRLSLFYMQTILYPVLTDPGVTNRLVCPTLPEEGGVGEWGIQLISLDRVIACHIHYCVTYWYRIPVAVDG